MPVNLARLVLEATTIMGMPCTMTAAARWDTPKDTVDKVSKDAVAAKAIFSISLLSKNITNKRRTLLNVLLFNKII